ncbi:MAG: hypothetical protein E5X40_14335 [Mesorhizobium sp.]|nr:MAG: hypothetical protein E5X40_14335 [Mesorhizobium sp.]
MVDANPATAYEKLLNAYLPARQMLDGVPKPPEKADAYQLTLEGALAGYGDTLKNDPIMPDARKLAHETGMSQDQFQKFVGGFINIMHDKGAFAPMPTDAKIAEGLIDPSLQGQARAEAVTGSTKRLTDARAWVDGLKDDQSGYSAHERAELAMMVNSPGGVALVERMMKGGRQQTVNPGGQGGGDANLQAEYEKRLQDPRNRDDAAFAAETREMSKRVFARR